MAKRRDLQREFAKSYLGDSKRWLRVPQATMKHARSIQSVVVDTQHVSNGTQRLTQTWVLPGTSGTPRATAHRATVRSSEVLMRGLHRATADNESISSQPAEAVSEDIEMTAWHHGDEFILYATGSVSSVLHHCNVTENEREHIMMAARRLIADGFVVFATARGTFPDTKLRPGTLTFDGLVACELTIYPGTKDAVSSLRKRDITVIYMTSYPEEFATAIAHATGITDTPSLAHHASFVGTPTHAIYAHVTRHHARRILAQLPPATIVARHSLVEIEHMIASY